MTVSKIYAPTRTVGNGSTSQFTADFQVSDETDLVVSLMDTGATTNKAVQGITSNYTVTLNPTTENATVTMLVTPPSTKDVLIERVLTETQPTDIPDVAKVRESVLEGAYDKNTKLIQQLSEKIGRQPIMTVDNDTLLTYDYELPAAVDDKILAWSVSGSNASIVNSTSDLSDFDGAVASAAAQATIATSQATIATTQATTATSQATIATSQATIATNQATIASSLVGGVNANTVEWSATSSTELSITSGSVFTGVVSGNAFTFQSNITVDITTSGVGGLNTGAEASSTWYYIVALGDSTATNNPSAWLVTDTNYSSFTSGDLPSGYDDYKRIGCVYNNQFSNFMHGEYREGVFIFHDPEGNGAAAMSTSSTTHVDATAEAVPPISRLAQIRFNPDSAASGFWRSKATSKEGYQVCDGVRFGLDAKVVLDSSQKFQYKISTGTLVAKVTSYYDDLSEEGQ